MSLRCVALAIVLAVAVAPACARDPASPSDLSAAADLRAVDLAAAGDLASPVDLSAPVDLASPGDLARAADLVVGVAMEGERCGQSANGRACAGNLACCYPCGVPGCDWQCTPPCDPGPGCANGCRLLP